MRCIQFFNVLLATNDILFKKKGYGIEHKYLKLPGFKVYLLVHIETTQKSKLLTNQNDNDFLTTTRDSLSDSVTGKPESHGPWAF